MKGDLVKLRPFLNDGIIKVGGRLASAPISETMKHPIILPKNHHIIDLIVTDHHIATGHSGCDIVLVSI